MSAKLWFFAVLISILASPLRIQAQAQREGTPNDVRQEVRELKQLILELTARMQILERRLSHLENSVEVRSISTRNMRPLGRHHMVDEKGTIWKHGKAVGHWGVNGGMERAIRADVDRRPLRNPR